MTVVVLQPLFIDGRRDLARRYIDTETGEVISRRQQMLRTERVSPEQKAVRRVERGQAKPGVTYRKYQRKQRTQPPGPEVDPVPEIESRPMPFKDSPRGVSQLVGNYRFYNHVLGRIAISRGYSTAILTSRKPRYFQEEFEILRRQAVRNAIAKFQGNYNWEWVGIDEEHWIDW